MITEVLGSVKGGLGAVTDVVRLSLFFRGGDTIYMYSRPFF